MTRMIPATIHPDVRSGAERRMFSVIRDAKDSASWVCLHSLALARHQKKRRGEIDFLLLTPMGVFTLEVKGGGVKRVAGEWHFTDRFDRVHKKIEGPFDQAAGAMFSLESELCGHFKDNKRRSKLLYGYGVVLPDVPFSETGCEADRRQVYDYDDRQKSFTDYVNKLASFAREADQRSRFTPTENDIEALVGFLRPDFDLVPPLGVQADEASSKLMTLQREQYAVIDAWEQYGHPRVLVQGGAGTGKTLLAVEAAIREARQIEGNVLLICFNKLLAKYLAAVIKARHPKGNIKVFSIYGLLNDLIGESKHAQEFSEIREACSSSELYEQHFPEFAMRVLLESEPERFETLVIDEAQDMMTSDLMDVLDGLLSNGLKEGRWRIFCDINNQASVFGRFEDSTVQMLESLGKTSFLAANRRNTVPVADETQMLTRPRIFAPALVKGFPVQYWWYKDGDSQQKKVGKALGRLANEGVAPGRITILSPRNLSECCAIGMTAPDMEEVSWSNVGNVMAGKNARVTYSTVSAFKGLENDFILLTDVEDIESEWWRSVIYVGMSRARVGLHLFITESLKGTYDLRIQQWMTERATKVGGLE